MRIPKEWQLTLNDDTFNALKQDFDHVLSRTLDNMQKKGSEYAEVKVVLKISLLDGETAKVLLDTDSKPDMIVPRFDHKVTSVLQIKDEASGTLGGNYELAFDAESGGWKIREIISPQQSLQDYYEPGEPEN